MSKPGLSGLSRRPPWPVVLALVAGLALTLVAFWSVRSASHERMVLRFESAATHLERLAAQRIERDLEVIYSLRDAYHVQGGMTREAFGLFARGQLSRAADIQALEWVPRVRAADRAAYEAAARGDGLAGFQLTERGPGGGQVPATAREVYYPVYYVEPLAGNEPALGFAPVLPSRDEAIALARDTARPIATRAFDIVQASDRTQGVAVFLPVYRTLRPPATVEARREQLVGLMEGVVLPGEVLSEVVAEASRLGILVGLKDAGAPAGAQTLFEAPPAMPPAGSPWRRDVAVEMGQRPWVLSLGLADQRLLGGVDPSEWLVLLAGLAGTAVLAGYLQLIHERRLHGERLLAERTGALERSREVQRRNNEFVNAFTHDLRTPLTTIKGYAELLEDESGGPLSEEQRDYVSQIERSTHRLEHLVDDLLDVARLDAGVFKLRRAPADLVETVHEVAKSLGPLAGQAGLTLVVPQAPAPMAATMDAERIERVLVNLIHNAIKFTAPGGEVRVRVVEEGPEALRCEVADTGQGIPEAQIPRLFQRFSQLEAGSRRGGSGLGLSIAKAIVEAHGGDIGVESAPGRGATFWFTLPRA